MPDDNTDYVDKYTFLTLKKALRNLRRSFDNDSPTQYQAMMAREAREYIKLILPKFERTDGGKLTMEEMLAKYAESKPDGDSSTARTPNPRVG